MYQLLEIALKGPLLKLLLADNYLLWLKAIRELYCGISLSLALCVCVCVCVRTSSVLSVLYSVKPCTLNHLHTHNKETFVSKSNLAFLYVLQIVMKIMLLCVYTKVCFCHQDDDDNDDDDVLVVLCDTTNLYCCITVLSYVHI